MNPSLRRALLAQTSSMTPNFKADLYNLIVPSAVSDNYAAGANAWVPVRQAVGKLQYVPVIADEIAIPGAQRVQNSFPSDWEDMTAWGATHSGDDASDPVITLVTSDPLVYRVQMTAGTATPGTYSLLYKVTTGVSGFNRIASTLYMKSNTDVEQVIGFYPSYITSGPQTIGLDWTECTVVSNDAFDGNYGFSLVSSNNGLYDTDIDILIWVKDADATRGAMLEINPPEYATPRPFVDASTVYNAGAEGVKYLQNLPVAPSGFTLRNSTWGDDFNRSDTEAGQLGISPFGIARAWNLFSYPGHYPMITPPEIADGFISSKFASWTGAAAKTPNAIYCAQNLRSRIVGQKCSVKWSAGDGAAVTSGCLAVSLYQGSDGPEHNLISYLTPHFTFNRNAWQIQLRDETRSWISGIDIVDGGADYEVGDRLTALGGKFDVPAEFVVAAVDEDGAVTDVGAITSVTPSTDSVGGSYITQPTGTLSVSGGAGSGFTFEVTSWGLGPFQTLASGNYPGGNLAADDKTIYHFGYDIIGPMFTAYVPGMAPISVFDQRLTNPGLTHCFYEFFSSGATTLLDVLHYKSVWAREQGQLPLEESVWRPYEPYRFLSNLRTAAGATQHVLYSCDASNAAWTKTGLAAPVASSALSKLQAETVYRLAEDASNGVHGISQATGLGAVQQCATAIVAAVETRYVRLRLNNDTDHDIGATVFDLAGGTVISGPGKMDAQLLGDGVCVLWTVGTPTVVGSVVYLDLSADGETWSYAGTAGNGVDLHYLGCLAESTFSSPVVAVDAAVTRGSQIAKCGTLLTSGAWTRRDTISIPPQGVVDGEIIVGTDGGAIPLKINANYSLSVSNGVNTVSTPAAAVGIGDLVEIVTKFDGTKLSIFSDAKLQVSSALALDLSGANIAFGSKYDGSGGGRCRLVSSEIWNRALNDGACISLVT